MKNSKIEWTDHTFNPWEGCTKVSPGCLNCYAETRNARFGGGTAPNWGKGAPRRRTSASNWAQPVKWNEQARHEWELVGEVRELGGRATYHRPRVFCASLADWLDEEVPIQWLADLLDLIRRTPSLDWLLLTKRPENWVSRMGEATARLTFRVEDVSWLYEWRDGHPPANVWVGTSVEDQPRADERIPALLRIPARVRFLSCEPLLGPVDLEQARKAWTGLPGIDWVIAGGESGSGARPMHPSWARSLRDQCHAAGVPFLFKQWGEWAPQTQVPALALTEKSAANAIYIHTDGTTCPASHGARADRVTIQRVGKLAAGRILDGREWNEVPGGAS